VILWVACPLAALQVQGQIMDFDALAIASDSVVEKAQLNGYASVSFNSNKQRVVVNSFKTDLSVAYEKKKTLIVVNGNNQATLDGENQVLNTGNAMARYLYGFRRTLYPEVFAQFQWDVQRGLNERKLGGANLRFTFINKQPHQFFGALGAFVEWELWNNTAVPDDRQDEIITQTTATELIKLNIFLKYVFTFREKSQLAIHTYIQTRPDSFYRYPRIAPRASMNLHLGGNFYFNVTFSGIYDFKPVVPIDRFFYSWENALVYRF